MIRKYLKISVFHKNFSFATLSIFLILIFFMGGGARADIQSLVLLRPLAFLILAVGIFQINAKQVQQYKSLFIFSGVIFFIALLHIIPLPPSLWQMLPGRQLATEVASSVGQADLWRPLSLTPYASWNALYSLVIPAAVLVLGVQLSPRQLGLIVILLFMIGIFSGFLGFLQILGPTNGPLYLYRITNPEAAVGLFANRNHQAMFLAMLFPMIATILAQPTWKWWRPGMYFWGLIAASAFLLPLILVTGARVGAVLAIIGLCLALFIGRIGVSKRIRIASNWKARLPYVGGIGGVAIFIIASIYMNRAVALERFFNSASEEDLRWQVWHPIAQMSSKYAPVGSGNGSFADIYKVDEPEALLGLNYLNHAHNDYLETYLTMGWIGIILLFAVIVGWFLILRSTWMGRKQRGGQAFPILGLSIMFMLGLASMVDYPLRVPSLAALFCIGAIFCLSKTPAEKR